MKIRWKLLFSMVAISILPALLIAGFSSYKISNYLEVRQRLTLEKESIAASEHLENFMRLRHRDLRLLQAYPVLARSLITDFDYSDVDTLLAQLVADKDNPFSFYMLTREDGICVGASTPKLIGKKNAQKKWHQETLTQGCYVSDWNKRPDKALLSNPPFGGDYRYTIVFSSVIKDDQGKNLGTINTRMKWQLIQQWLESQINNFRQTDWKSKSLTLIREDGTVIAHEQSSSYYEKKIKEFITDEKSIQLLFNKENGSFSDPGHGSSRIWAFATVHLDGFKWKVLTSVDKEEFYQVQNDFTKTFTIVFLFCIAGSVIIGIVTGNSIVRPLNHTVAVLQDIAAGDGDLTARLPALTSGKKGDEINELSVAFNTFVGKLQTIFKKITANVETLNNSSSDLTDIADTFAAGSQQASDCSKTVASAADELSNKMNSIRAAEEEASINISQVADASEEVNSTFSDIADQTKTATKVTNEAVQQARTATTKVAELGQAASKVGEVVETITEISEKTSLLALNATIEAARAGEAGKGFAVVANEIKELASQTFSATNEIETRISGILSSVDGTVTTIDQISSVIDRVNEIVSTIATSIAKHSETMVEITNNVSHVSGGIIEITGNVAQSSTLAKQVAADIFEVNTSADGINRSSNQLKHNAEDLANLATEIKGLVDNFKL